MVKPTATSFYEIRVRGVLGDTLLHAFPSLTGATQGSDTVLTGQLVDQAALYGVLGQLESFGLELLAVRQVAPN